MSLDNDRCKGNPPDGSVNGVSAEQGVNACGYGKFGTQLTLSGYKRSHQWGALRRPLGAQPNKAMFGPGSSRPESLLRRNGTGFQ